MEPTILSSPRGENFAIPTDPKLFYQLTTAEVIRFRELKFKPSEIMVYCYIKTSDPFGHGFRFLPKQIALVLNYDHRTVSRAFKALTKAGELAIAFVEAHVRVVATAVESVAEIVSKLGTKDIPTPFVPIAAPLVETFVEPIPTPPTPEIQVETVVAPIPVETAIPPVPTYKPQQNQQTTTATSKGFSPIGNVIANLGFPQPSASPTIVTEIEIKTPEWFERIEFQLNAMNIKLADVLHALKKYPVQAIEAAITHTQKQNWSNAKAGVFVNFLKKWQPNANRVKTKASTSQPATTALMKRFPDIAGTLSKEKNPIDEATLDYLEELRVNGMVYGTHYTTIHNFYGVFITIKDYPHPIPWWEAVPQLQQLYPLCA